MNIQRQHWIRFESAGATGFGTLDGNHVAVHRGDMFSNPEPTGETLPLEFFEPMVRRVFMMPKRSLYAGPERG